MHFGSQRAEDDIYAEILEIDKIVLGLGPEQLFQKIDGFCEVFGNRRKHTGAWATATFANKNVCVFVKY